MIHFLDKFNKIKNLPREKLDQKHVLECLLWSSNKLRTIRNARRKKNQYFSILLLQPKMRIAIRDTYKALQPLKFCMQVRWGCAALSQERAAFSQASKAMLVFREISLMLCNRAVAVVSI